MANDEAENTPRPAPESKAENLRGGEHVPRTRVRRLIYLAGSLGLAILAFLLIRMKVYW